MSGVLLMMIINQNGFLESHFYFYFCCGNRKISLSGLSFTLIMSRKARL